jgi:nucleotide sugar dehydrogenase
MCIKSTVVPGTTDRLASETGKKIVFSPEYIGETPFHLSKQITSCDLVAVGGEAATCDLFIKLYQLVLGPEPHYFRTTAATAELAKYMENCFFATKVSFAAQFCLLATAFGADFTVMREIWVADRRVGRSHSTVIGSLGFGGKCLPKDLRAIISWAKEVGANPMLLEAIQEFNESIQQLNQG